ncbi:MAG: TIGR01459 family HAD-type hydrolase [Azospirillaceae bacterium]|nr:TIGR01459 family HAD-type hydrolase [Azospirillaceae bacterium]
MLSSNVIIPGLAAIADHYDGLIVDLWGVLHDGIRAYPGAIDCLRQLKAIHKPVCLLSNVPRRSATVMVFLEELGITRDLYDHLVTSGEAAHQALLQSPDAWHAALGPRCFHLGPERDRDVFVGIPYQRVERLEDADFVVASAPWQSGDPLENYEALLADCAKRHLPMICTNPDLVVMSGAVTVICAGTLAARYEALGGDVHYYGKPHAPIYRVCLSLLKARDPARILGVGDSFHTDVTGARTVGCGALLIAGGIHVKELTSAWGQAPEPERLADAIARYRQTPDATVACFAW